MDYYNYKYETNSFSLKMSTTFGFLSLNLFLPDTILNCQRMIRVKGIVIISYLGGQLKFSWDK
jgi:hypothetical protein